MRLLSICGGGGGDTSNLSNDSDTRKVEKLLSSFQTQKHITVTFVTHTSDHHGNDNVATSNTLLATTAPVSEFFYVILILILLTTARQP